jgi:hypothetical protein
MAKMRIVEKDLTFLKLVLKCVNRKNGRYFKFNFKKPCQSIKNSGKRYNTHWTTQH